MDVPAQFHFQHRRLVEFADTDLAGIMHFANVFRYVESAEHAFFRSLGHRVHTTHGADQTGWPRLEVSCKYLQPARFEQTLAIGLRIEELRTTSLRYSFWILNADPDDRALIATGSFATVHVELNANTQTIRKAPIPPALRTSLEAIMGSNARPS